MPYIYSIIIFTIWAAFTAFSSSALISYENNKQRQALESIVVPVVKTGVATIPKRNATSSIKQVVKVEAIKTKASTTPKKQTPLYSGEEEENDD